MANILEKGIMTLKENFLIQLSNILGNVYAWYADRKWYVVRLRERTNAKCAPYMGAQ